jgi:hypothetical protein
MHIVTKEQFETMVGKTVYKVYGLGGQSFIESFVVLSKPHFHPVVTGGISDKFLMIDVDKNGRKGEAFLGDMGIPDDDRWGSPTHRAYDNENEALAYLKYAKTMAWEPSINIHDDFFDDENDMYGRLDF